MVFGIPYGDIDSSTITVSPKQKFEKNPPLIVPYEQGKTLFFESMHTILSSEELKNIKVGLSIYSLDRNAALFEHQPHILLNPASNMKILTAATAISFLGPTYSFRTQWYHDGSLNNGILKGNVYIKGFGDPYITTSKIIEFSSRIRSIGIEKIEGDLVFDESFFDKTREGPGWEQEDTDYSYMAPIGALSVNFNTVSVNIIPSKTAPEKAQVFFEPQTEYIVPEFQVITKNKSVGTRLFIASIPFFNRNKLTVKGTVPKGKTPLTYYRKIHFPAHYFATLVKESLIKQGISFSGSIRFQPVPDKAILLETFQSPELWVIINELQKYSNNFIAEQIFKTVGAEILGTPGSWEKGSRVVENFLNEVGIPQDSYIVKNGSGLNDVNRVTASQIVQVLRYMYKNRLVQPEFMGSFAIGGKTGTVGSRFRHLEPQRIRAKTGSLENVSALSGYILSQTDELFAFSVLMNSEGPKPPRLQKIQDKIIEHIHNFRTVPVMETGNDNSTQAETHQ